MPLFLAGLLVRGGAVAPDVMEEALQRQILYGGALDTNLLEIGAIDETTLAPYLARASGLALAPAQAFDDVEPRVRRAFPARLAERHGVVPFRLDGRTLEVACTYPVEGSLIDEISFMLSLILRPHVALEFRVRLAVERLYGHAAAQRFYALSQRSMPAQPAAPPEEPRRDEADQGRSQPTTWTVDQALALLRDAPDRDRAIEVVLRFARRVFEYAAAFVVLGGNAIGWDAMGPDPEARRRASQVALPVEAPSILRTVVETQGRYLGPIPADEHHGALLEALGRRPPRSAFLQPVAIGNRVVAVVFADNGEKPVSPLGVAQVMRLVQGLSSALEAMIVARKTAMAQAVDRDGPTPPSGVDVAAFEAAREPPRPVPAHTAGDDITDPVGHAALVVPVAPPPPLVRAAPSPARMSSTEQARKQVEQLLAARSSVDRERALAALQQAGAGAAEMLVALLPGPGGLPTTSAAQPRSPIVAALARLGDAAVPALLRAARASAAPVRFWAAALLARSDLPAAREALVALSGDADPSTADMARSAALSARPAREA